MGKKSRLKKERRELRAQNIHPACGDDTEMHAFVPVVPGSTAIEVQKKLTIEYQKQIKASPMWKQIVDELGEEKAEKLLKQCKAKVE